MSYPATDLIDAAVWHGRITSKGKRVTGFIYDLRYQPILEPIPFHNDKDGYHYWTASKLFVRDFGLPDSGRVKIQAHEIVYVLQHGHWSKCQIDHVHGKHDNRSSSLRPMTLSGQRRNHIKQKADGLPWGVTWNTNSKKYHACGTDVTGRRISLGRFDNLAEATKAVDAFNSKLTTADQVISDLVASGQIDPLTSRLPAGVIRRGDKFSAQIYANRKGVYLGTHPTAAVASLVCTAARTVREAGGTVDQMKQAAKAATEGGAA